MKNHTHTPERPIRPILLVFACLVLASALPAANFATTQLPDRLIITDGSNTVAHFVFADTNILRPYFAHVHTPDGIQVTRTHPPVTGVDPVDHATMHPGIWLAFGDIGGQDFWRNKATIRHDRFIGPASASADRLVFATHATLVSSNATTVAILVSSFTIQSIHAGYLLWWRATVIPETDSFIFGDQEEMGFGIRIATPLSEKNGGTLKNSDGLTGAKSAWGKTAAWCDYSGVLSNRLVGITVMADPNNFRPSWFHSRDYGLIVANPFGQKAFTKGEASNIPVKRHAQFELSFAAFIHSSATNDPPNITGAYGAFTHPK